MCIGIFTEILKATYIDANVANPVSQRMKTWDKDDERRSIDNVVIKTM